MQGPGKKAGVTPPFLSSQAYESRISCKRLFFDYAGRKERKILQGVAGAPAGFLSGRWIDW